jgi:hypothetical protein
MGHGTTIAILKKNVAAREGTMTPHTPSTSLVAVSPIAERRRRLRRESLRDFVGVAVGVAAGALVWLAFVSVARLPF